MQINRHSSGYRRLRCPTIGSMKPIVWTLLLSGVALNAAAQLLLKAATR
jgi:hypothetical protein